jgi:hypothetical protein
VLDFPTAADLLRPLIGRQLVGATEARHWHDGKRDSDASLLHFWLHFKGAPAVMAHVHGEQLMLTQEEPYVSYDMQEHGKTRVGPAQPPDRLAGIVGGRLVNAALLDGPWSAPHIGGIWLRFEHRDLLAAAMGDEWLLSDGGTADGPSNAFTMSASMRRQAWAFVPGTAACRPVTAV